MAPPPLFTDAADRQPPVAIEAEVSVLGACLMDPDALSKVAELLPAEDAFYREGHRRMYRAMLRIFGRSEPVEPTSLMEELRKTGDLEAAGGGLYIAELLDAVPTAANVSYHARLVSDRAILRRLISAQTEGVRDCFEPGERSVQEILDEAERRIMEVGTARSTGRMAGMREAMGPALEIVEEAQRSEGGVTGVPTGFRELDNMTGGFQPASLIVLAARPSMGKSALAVGHILAAAVQHQKKVAVFSYEMTKEEIVHRMLSWEGMVPLGRLIRGGLQDDDYNRLHTASALIHAAPVWMEDKGRPTVLDVRARARRLVSESDGLDLLIVDYLQLMHGRSGENRNQEISEITRGLKELARELHVPVIALSQLSRKPEERGDKRPQLSDLRDSGAIEQDADLVMFLHRPEYYLKEAEIAEKGLRGKAELIIGKQRNGPTGTVDLFFRSECARFEDAEQYR